MNEFLKECLSEWKRLGVADAIAAEMAAELTADLAEAAAEGAGVEAVLGTSAFEPRAFAAAWATERGVVPPAPTEVLVSPPGAPMPHREPDPVATPAPVPAARWQRRLVPVLIAAFVLLGVFGAGLAFSTVRESRAVVSKVVPANPDGSPDQKPSFGLKQLPGAVVVPPGIEMVPRLVVPGSRAVVTIGHPGRKVRILGLLLIVVAIGGVAIAGFGPARRLVDLRRRRTA